MEEAKRDISEIEQKIKDLLTEFVRVHGYCDIQLYSELSYHENQHGDVRKLAAIDVKMKVSI